MAIMSQDFTLKWSLYRPFIIIPVMLIEEKPLTSWIDDFYGYRSWQARLWLVGYKENGGDVPEEVTEKINHFCSLKNLNPTLYDISELNRHVTLRRN